MKIFHDKYDGYTELSFSERGGETVADACIARGQARISAKLRLNGEDTPCYFLITMGGGLTEGETYETKLNARAGTHAVVTTQAPAYVFQCINGETTRSNFDVKVGRDAALEYLPDDVIPYGRSRYVQTSDIHVAKGGSLMYTDGITAGWSPQARRRRGAGRGARSCGGSSAWPRSSARSACWLRATLGASGAATSCLTG
ncbi:MAG: urease accessory protein UreD [Aeriscardovia sp.]|nr:urease accessory protein UreD [Aeriscardovia sp.]